MQHLSAVSAEDQSTEEWLLTHSIEFQKLSLKDLVDKGKIGKWVLNLFAGYNWQTQLI